MKKKKIILIVVIICLIIVSGIGIFIYINSNKNYSIEYLIGKYLESGQLYVIRDYDYNSGSYIDLSEYVYNINKCDYINPEKANGMSDGSTATESYKYYDSNYRYAFTITFLGNRDQVRITNEKGESCKYIYTKGNHNYKVDEIQLDPNIGREEKLIYDIMNDSYNKKLNPVFSYFDYYIDDDLYLNDNKDIKQIGLDGGYGKIKLYKYENHEYAKNAYNIFKKLIKQSYSKYEIDNENENEKSFYIENFFNTTHLYLNDNYVFISYNLSGNVFPSMRYSKYLKNFGF